MSDSTDPLQNKINTMVNDASEIAKSISNKLQEVDNIDNAAKLANDSFNEVASTAINFIKLVDDQFGDVNSIDDAVKLANDGVNTVADNAKDTVSDLIRDFF